MWNYFSDDNREQNIKGESKRYHAIRRASERLCGSKAKYIWFYLIEIDDWVTSREMPRQLLPWQEDSEKMKFYEFRLMKSAALTSVRRGKMTAYRENAQATVESINIPSYRAMKCIKCRNRAWCICENGYREPHIKASLAIKVWYTSKIMFNLEKFIFMIYTIGLGMIKYMSNGLVFIYFI